MGIEDNVTEVAKSTLEAYKTNPMLTGLLALNLVFLIGFGWFLVKKNEAHEALVARILDEEKVFRQELVAAATDCNDVSTSSGKPGYFKLQGVE
jgi:hypothetical protein